MDSPIVVLHPSQARVTVDQETERIAIDSAYRLLLSPHEWTWTQAEQEAMARFVLLSHQQLSAIRQVASSMEIPQS